MERIRREGINTPDDLALIYGVSLPSRDQEQYVMTSHIEETSKAQFVALHGPRAPGDLELLWKYANNMYTKRMFDPIKIKVMKHKATKLLPELLEWCDRPEDDRRRWHIANRYLEE